MTNQSDQSLEESIIKLIESQSCICDRYIDIHRIDQRAGDGKFSLVFKAKDKNSHSNPRRQKIVALKFYNPLINDKYREDCFYRESDILKNLKGQPNILPLIQGRTNFRIVVPYNKMEIPISFKFYSSELAESSVENYIYNSDIDPLSKILLFREICKAVQRIHSKNICHRDLKPGNFLIFKGNNICLSDFGTAKYIGHKGHSLLENYPGAPGDKRYTAPELLCGLHFYDKFNYLADIYSLGVILFELFTRHILNLVVYKSINNIIGLSSNFHIIPEEKRIYIFDDFIDGFAKDKGLPNIELYDDALPKVIAHEVDDLYKNLAAFNYKDRLIDFQRIFLRINICEKIIRNLNKVKKWRKKRRINY